MLAFIRAGDGEEILCLFNLGTAAADVPAPGALTPLTDSGFAAGIDGGRRMVTLAAGQAFFARLG